MSVGEVVDSRAEGFAPGDAVSHGWGWRDLAVVGAGVASVGGVGTLARIDTTLGPPEMFLGPLGNMGLTAYVGLLDGAQLRDGDIVCPHHRSRSARPEVPARVGRARGPRPPAAGYRPDRCRPRRSWEQAPDTACQQARRQHCQDPLAEPRPEVEQVAGVHAAVVCDAGNCGKSLRRLRQGRNQRTIGRTRQPAWRRLGTGGHPLIHGDEQRAKDRVRHKRIAVLLAHAPRRWRRCRPGEAGSR